MTRKSRILLLITLITNLAIAQKSKITTAIVEYNEGDYVSALENLNTALQDKLILDNESIGKALYYKGRTLINLYVNAARIQDEAALTKYEMAIADAIDCFVKSEEYELKETYRREMIDQAALTYNTAVGLSMSYYSGNDLAKALHFAEAAEAANKHFVHKNLYMALDMKAKIYLAQGDSTQALHYFEQEVKSYNAAPPDQPDYYTAYTYYFMAMIHRYNVQNEDAAFLDVENGLKFLSDEHARDAVKDDEREQIYQITKQDLETFQLDLYLNAPHKLAEALQKFESALKNDPGNTTVRIAYASMLEKSDSEAAETQYKKVLEAEPKNFTALFNLGALYVNRAAVYYVDLLNTDDYEKADELEAKGNSEYQKAYPLFQKAHMIQPEDRSVISALLQICLHLDMTEEYQKYESLLSR